MGICGMSGAVRGKRRTITTTADPIAARHPDLTKRQWGLPARPDQWWVADFTYTWTLAGFVYTAFCVDVFSRRILGLAGDVHQGHPTEQCSRTGGFCPPQN